MGEDQEPRIETKVRVPKTILDDLKKFGAESGLPINQVMIDSFEEKIHLWKSGGTVPTDETRDLFDQLLSEIQKISHTMPENIQNDEGEGIRKIEKLLQSLMEELHSCQGTILRTLKDALNESSQAGEASAKTNEETLARAGQYVETISTMFKSIAMKEPPAPSVVEGGGISRKTIMGSVVAAMTAGMIFFALGLLDAPKPPPDPRLKDLAKYEIGWKRYEEVRSILNKLPKNDRKRIVPFVAQQMMTLERNGEN